MTIPKGRLIADKPRKISYGKVNIPKLAQIKDGDSVYLHELDNGIVLLIPTHLYEKKPFVEG